MKQVIYIAHPVSGDVRANVDKVLGWVRWLTKVDPSRVYVAPWVAEVLAFVDEGDIDPAFYDRVLGDDEDVVRHLDGVLICGGRTRPNGTLQSVGMTREVAANAMAGGVLFDLSNYETWEEADVAYDHSIYGPPSTAGGKLFIDDHMVRPKLTEK